jgi:hypothetical protein
MSDSLTAFFPADLLPAASIIGGLSASVQG